MKTINILMISVYFIIILFLIQSASALTASSDNYSVSMFGIGLATSNPSSTNYTAESLSTSQSGTRNAESDSYTANLGFFENTTYYKTVSITSYSISPRSAAIGSVISLTISALNSQAVWAKITSPNSQEQTLSLINNQAVSYLPSSYVLGRYNVVFYANSSSGAIASAVDYFDLTQQTTPPPSTGGGGGGGGTTTIIEKCTYLWDCTPWGLCAEGKQRRECKNTGTCNGTESKPLEEMQCSMALFDISLKLKDIKLTENKTLRFNIDLIEKIGIEKIDVYIKYTIIDKNNEEIFSQIETKAVQGNLSYQKEIEEIKLADGKYTLRADIFYGYQQRAFAEQKIKVMNGKIEITPKERASIFDNIKNALNKNSILIALIVLIVLMSTYYLLFIFRKDHHEAEFDKRTGSRRKYFVYVLLALFIVALLIATFGLNITGMVINRVLSHNWRIILIPLLIISILALLILLRKKFALICKKRRQIKEAKLKVIPLEAKPLPFEEVEIEGDRYLEIKPKPLDNLKSEKHTYTETSASETNIFLKLKEFLGYLLNKPKKYPSNSILGLINKKVYSESGHYLGEVNDVILGENRIESLKINVDKKHKLKAKGVIINYKHVKSIGEIIIIDEAILEKIE